MKKFLLAVALSCIVPVSIIQAFSDYYSWKGAYTLRDGNHFFRVSHTYGDGAKICLYGGIGDPDHGGVIESTICDRSKIDLPYDTIIRGFQVVSKQGLHLRYNMSKSQFEDAFRRANLQYTR